MREYIAQRAIELAHYFIETEKTVREAAKVFHISKSTVHKDVAERLQDIDDKLFDAVRKVLDFNLSERHLRGGEATKNKFLAAKQSIPENL